MTEGARRGSEGVVGREPERAVIAEVIAGALSEPRALLLEGGPGIGKTALWRAGVTEASRSGLRVLTSSPVSGEARLSFAALEDVLGDQLSDVAPLLPRPQRRALEVAFLRVDSAGEAVDERTVAAATLNALRLLAEEEPLLLAIDDIQWLDEPSESALRYAVRRLGAARVSFLACVRTEHAEAPPTAIEAAFEARSDTVLDRLHVGPLSAAEIHHVIRERLGVSFSHDVLTRIHDASGGNPFHALELARALHRRDQLPEPGSALPVPATLRDVVQASLDALSPPANDLLAVVAALSDPMLETVEAAGEGGAVDEAVRAGVLEVDPDRRLRFTHPLLASAALARLGPQAQRELHRRLAQDVRGEERARHLALGASGPSAEIADALDDAARAAADRGAIGAAASLASSAVRLTPAERADDRTRRELDAAGYETRNGDWQRARARMEPLLDTLPAGELRAAVSLRLARIANTARHLELCRRAIDEATGDALLAQAHQLAAEGSMMAGDVPGAAAHARTATRLAEEVGEGPLLVECLGTLCHYESFTGSITPGMLERAVELERSQPRPGNYSPRTIIGVRMMYADRLDEARSLLEASYATATDLGFEYDRAWCLGQLTQLECRAGRLAAADRHAREAAITHEQIGGMEMISCFLTALVGTSVGRVEETRAAAGEGVARAAEEGYELFRILNLWALGLLELAVGDAVTADGHLRDLPAAVDAMGYAHPGVRPVYADAIEARIATGDLSGEADVDELARRGAAFGSPWARATAARCRGLLLASRGDSVAAVAELERALREHESCPQPVELGRTLLALGTVERRAKHRAAARDALGKALELFDALGTPLWAERAAAELQRLPGRRPSASTDLTDTERRVAELVADGLTNKQVAAQLFVTVRTVEANLTKVYAKLGVRSRTELTAKLHR